MTNEQTLQKAKTLLDQLQGYAVKTVLGLAVATTLLSSYGYNDGGVVTRLKEPSMSTTVEGELPAGVSWIKDEGYYLKMPFVSRTREFNKNGTIAATNNEALMDAASIVVPPMIAPFADAFQMQFEWSVRYEVATDDLGLENMYQKLKSQEALLGNTVMPFAQTLFTNSVNQMVGENFAQGGKSTLLTLVDNQARLGMYQTRVEKVPVVRKAGNGTNKTLGGTQTDLEITKVVYLKDEKTQQRLRTPLSIAQYGIKIVPNSFQIVENKAVGRLVKFIDIKQESQAQQVKEESDQKLLVRQAKSAQLKGEKSLVERTNVLNIQKQEAIIVMEKQVEQAKLQAAKEIVESQKVADLAIIDKTRELQIAKANEGIQKANATAAKHQASAIKLVGYAEAAVDSAKLRAKQDNQVIYIAEINRDIAIQQAKSMEKTTISTPNNVVIMGNGTKGKDNTSLSDLLNVKLARDITSAK